MKNKLLFLALMIIGAAVLPASEAPPAHEELAGVERFLSLSDTELDQLLRTIGRIRAMTPEQRVALQAEIARFRQLPEQQRERLRAGWGAMPRQVQDAWREMMQEASPEKRAAIQAELQALEPEAKFARRRQLAEEYLRAKAAKP